VVRPGLPRQWYAFRVIGGRDMAVAGVHLTRTFGETEGLFAAALDTMPTPVAILDGAGWILAVNASWRTLLRASGQRLPADGVAAEYLEIAILGALEWNHALTLRTSLGALLRGAVDRFQHLICGRREGAKHWYQVSATRIRVGGVVRIVVMHEDVSDAGRATNDQGSLGAAR